MLNEPNFSGVTEAQRLLITYWYGCRASDGLVPRDAIDPGIVRSTLACLSVVEVNEVGEGRFRIAGSRLRDIFGMDVRGRRIAEIAGAHGECYALGLTSAVQRGLRSSSYSVGVLSTKEVWLKQFQDLIRAKVPVFQPQPEGMAALSRRVKESFDPRGVLNPGRMYEGG